MNALISGPCGLLIGGDVPSWIEAIATLLAFCVALGVYIQSTSDKRKAQASLVSARLTYSRIKKPEGSSYPIEIGTAGKQVRIVGVKNHLSNDGSRLITDGDGLEYWWILRNDSNQMLGAIKVLLVDEKDIVKHILLDQLFFAPQYILEVRTLMSAVDPLEGGLKIKVQFQDAVGRYWERCPGRPLKRIRNAQLKGFKTLRLLGTWKPADPDSPRLLLFTAERENRPREI